MASDNIKLRRAAHDRENPYFLMRRDTAQDARLRWEARGLLAYLLSKPDDWEIIIGDLVKQSPGGRDKVYGILVELRRFNYLRRERTRDTQGRWVYGAYEVFEAPYTAFPYTDDPYTANPTLQNTEQTKERKHTAAPAAGGASKNEMYDAIRDVWGYTGGLNGDIAKMLTGKATKKAYAPYNITPAVTPDELRAWAASWKREHPGLSMLEERGKVQSSINAWRATRPTSSGAAQGGASSDDALQRAIEANERAREEAARAWDERHGVRRMA